MAVFSVNEYDSAPSSPSQWDQYYNRADDNLYIQILQATTATTTTISTLTRASNVVTITTPTDHGLVIGDQVSVSGASVSSFNGTGFIVASVPTTTSLTYTQVDSNDSATGGTVSPEYPLWQAVTTGREVRDSVRVTDTLTRAKYIGRDYQTFLDEGFTWLREKYGDKFNDFAASDPAIMLVKYVASALDTLSWYMDKEATEWFWPLLRLRSRAELLAKYLAYKPRAAIACSADLDLTLTDGPYSFDIQVDKGFQFQGPNTLVFELTQDVYFTAGSTTATAKPSVQGETIEERFVSTGDAAQQLLLQALPEDTAIAYETVKVLVDGSEWEVVDFLPFERENKVEVAYGLTPPVVQFGDGVVGNIPDEGVEIVVQYIATYGLAGKSATVGTITDPVTPLVANLQTIPITANNPTGASGGYDIETLEEIKASAPAYFKTADRGVTKQDLTTLANVFSDGAAGSVSKAKANIVRGITADYALQALLAAIQTDIDSLEGYLNQISSEVDDIGSARSDIITNTGTITTKSTAIQTSVTSIENDIGSAKAGLERMPYQELFGKGDGSTTVFSGTLQKYPVATGSVFIWLSGSLTIEDSGTDGDCDTTPGVFTSASASFTSAHIGRVIKIGSFSRQVTRYISSTQVGYSGDLISGTGLSWVIYNPAIYATDDGAGNLTGYGISSGTVTYSSGAIASLTFSTAPDAGTDIMIQYGYEESSVTTYLNNVETEAGNIESAAGDIDTAVTEITSTDLVAISTAETNIDAQVVLALNIPASIESSIDDLESYLEEHLSAECKANIVMVQALVVDEDGYYAAPTQALLDALKVSLEEHNVVPTTIATVSGYRNVIEVNMTYQLAIASPYKYDEVQSRVEPVVDNMFKNRDYGVNLYRSYYYGLIVPDPSTGQGGLAGVSYANISITGTSFPDPSQTGTPASVDSDGNLMISDEYVLTKGTITYEEIS